MQTLLSPTLPDLSQCAAEPIHIPGSIQPRGTMLALDALGRIVQAGRNIEEYCGEPVEAILNQPVQKLFSTAQSDLFDGSVTTPRDVEIQFTHRSDHFHARARTHAGVTIVEIEPIPVDPPISVSLIHRAVSVIAGCLTVEEACQRTCDLLWEILGYDRVMVYRFDPDWNGQVIGETRADTLEPYLGLNYPASDIPSQARDLYRINRLRLLSDVAADPIPLVPPVNPVTGLPLDMTHCQLRDLSPVHREYLANMGVQATLVVSIVREDTLWGLIACHHMTPRAIGFDLRDFCELVAVTVATQLTICEARERFQAEQEASAFQQTFRSLLGNTSIPAPQRILQPRLLEVFAATGAAVRLDQARATLGEVPPPEDIDAIAAWVEKRDSHYIFETDRLGHLDPNFERLADQASGVLAIRFSTLPAGYLLLFRPEIPRTVHWGGNPEKPVEITQDGHRISPRKSFAAWQQLQHGHAHPWQPVHIATATTLRHLLWRSNFIGASPAEAGHQLLADSRIATFRTAADGRLIESDSEWRRFAGGAADLDANWFTCIDPRDREQMEKGWRRFVAGGHQHFAWECRFVRPGEDDHEENWLAVTVQRREGTEEFDGTAVDITARKKLEAEHLRINKLEAVGLLAGGIAHDFNNLLAAILGNIELLGWETDIKRNPRASKRLRDLMSACERAKKLAFQLLTFSKGGHPVKQIVQLTDYLTDLAQFYLHGSSISLRIDMKPNVSLVKLDPELFGMVIQNLVVNAREAMGETGTLTITAENLIVGPDHPLPLPAGPFVHLQFSDTGRGIAPEALNRIFDPYFTTKPAGSGLGLAVTFSIVRKHDGLITVESQLGVGTTFHVYLPSLDFIPPELLGVETAQDAAAPKASLRVLVLDDHEIILELFDSILTELGCSVDTVSTGKDAVERFTAAINQGAPYGVVFLDLTVPGGEGGVGILDRLKNIDPSVKAVACSGYADDPVLTDFSRYGFVARLIKPFNISEIITILAPFLQTGGPPSS